MISRKLMALLVGSAVLAWLTSGPDTAPSPGAVFPEVLPRETLARPSPVLEGEPWRRVIELPAEPVPEPVPEPMPELVFEPVPMPIMEPPPPPPPTAPLLPIEYLGQLGKPDQVVLYLRYQNRAQSMVAGEELDNLYRLERIERGRALFRYLPMDIQQELRWDAEL